MDATKDVEAQPEVLEKPPSSSSKEGKCNGDEEKKWESEDKPSKVHEYGDTSAAYWKLYGSEAEKYDQKLVDSLSGETQSMLILNGLFSSVVASFIIETYKTLQPGNNQPTGATQSSSSSSPSPPAAVRVNVLMFLSLFFSMTSVLASVLIQQWIREFIKYAYPRATPHKRGRVRTYLYQGIDQFQLKRFMYGVHVLLHISVFLFFWALGDFLGAFDETVGAVAHGCFWGLAVVYAVLSVSPFIFGNSPYHTALTPPLRSCAMACVTALLFLYHTIWRPLWRLPPRPLIRREYFSGLSFDRTRFLLKEADEVAPKLDAYAMEWLFTGNDSLDDMDMDQFLEGLQGYIRSPLTDSDHVPEVLTAEYILRRIKAHLMACAASFELPEEACTNRVLACANSLSTIFNSCTKKTTSEDAEGVPKKYIRGVIKALSGLCKEADSIVALRASCARGIAFHGLLTQLTESASESPQTLTYLVPLHTFFFTGDATSGAQQDHSLIPLPGTTSEQSQMDQTMLQTLLHDGPLVNLTLLAKAVVSRDDVDPSKLSFCWKTLDLLLKGLRIARTEVSDSVLSRFNHVHNETRKRVQTEGRSSKLTPLLEFLDAVARGQRLSVVFLNHHKYHGRAEIVFGKEHLRNPNLLQEFASCLPGFISVTDHYESTKFMEGLIREDGLWTCLKDNLLNALREDVPIPEKLRIFVACCMILDKAFIVLEYSQNVDWRTPEFGSLGQHFEIFVARCFQGTFIGRALSFRISITQARFCRALLAQFSREANRNGTVVFRSQWDVASLARLFYTLGVGGEEDAEFWSSFIDGGHVDAGFMTKTQDMLTKAVQDGPLLIFCKLGRLATTMVPFEESDLNDLDLKNLLDLLQSMANDSILPLKGASPEVWEDLSQLRDIISKSCDRGEDKLGPLFEKIEQVFELRPSASQESGPGDHLRAPDFETSTFVQPRLSSSRELRPSRNRSSDASGSSSTVIVDGRYEAPPTNENDREFAMDVHPDPQSTTLTYPPYSRNEYTTYHSASEPSHMFQSPFISPFNPSFPYIRRNIQHHAVPPAANIYPRSPSTLPTPRSPRPGSPELATAETASRSGHTNAADGAQSGAFVVPEIYEISESPNPT
ncbi:hypothetical protein H4582DRAFT_2074645 [Lactarius indigo]|nr:hypothetical protein H4582DRAFT_2074645 [Lactarius indigo]